MIITVIKKNSILLRMEMTAFDALNILNDI
jgi:hypothetical protein